jgi:hypothetical protein
MPEFVDLLLPLLGVEYRATTAFMMVTVILLILTGPVGEKP